MKSAEQSRSPLTTGLTVLFAVFVLLITGCHTAPNPYPWQTLDGKPPVVIAHRGDSGNYPEHTLAAYDSAYRLGADYIEPDVVLTKDGVPVCRHDLYLSSTTDVAKRPEFAHLRREKGNRQDWFVMDFTLAELKTLRAIQPVAGRGKSHDGLHAIPTLEELATSVRRQNRNTGRSVGLLIELKDPAGHRKAGMDLSAAVLGVLGQVELSGGNPPIIFQCFDGEEVTRLAGMSADPVYWLTNSEVDLDNLPEGCRGLGLGKSRVTFEGERSALIDLAHAKGLAVFCWTFRDDQLPKEIEGANTTEEMRRYLAAGVDGVITDFPATGVAARERIVDEHAAQGKSEKPLSRRIREQSPRRFLKRY